MNIVLSVYLTGRQDPQRSVFWKPDQDVVIRDWATSLEKCGLRGLVFHDHLSPEFCEKWASASLGFQQVQWRTAWTAAEERVRIYADWLRDNTTDIDIVLATDLSDVVFYGDPFPIIADANMLCIGSEPWPIGKTCIKDWMLRTYGEITTPDKPVLNPGIIGGKAGVVLNVLDRWNDEMMAVPTPFTPPHDIIAFNRLLYREPITFFTGHPLHTEFRKNEPAECGAAIKHK